jgi:hypothetical protein
MGRIGQFKMFFEYFPEKFAVTKGRFGPVSDAGKDDFEAGFWLCRAAKVAFVCR